VEFLTNDLSKFSLQEFEITDDDKLFLRNPDGTLEKQNFTGEIAFSTLLLSDDHDYLIYLKALFFRGELKELNFEELNKKENGVRKKIEKINDEVVRDYEKNKEKIAVKLYYFYVRIVNFALGTTRILLGISINLTWKLQRFLT